MISRPLEQLVRFTLGIFCGCLPPHAVRFKGKRCVRFCGNAVAEFKVQARVRFRVLSYLYKRTADTLKKVYSRKTPEIGGAERGGSSLAVPAGTADTQ